MEVPGFTILEEVYRGRTRVVYRGRRDADGVAVILKTSADALPAAASLQREYELIKDLDLPGAGGGPGGARSRGRRRRAPEGGVSRRTARSPSGPPAGPAARRYHRRVA